jgi:PAS domain S-box-containing protein
VRPQTLTNSLTRWLGGESFLAATGLSLAALIVGVVCLCGWWATQHERETVERGRAEQVRSVAEMLVSSGENALARGSHEDFRDQILAAATGSDLFSCRVVLADGTVLAGSAPGAGVSPRDGAWPVWPEAAAPTAGESVANGWITITHPIRVPDKGVAQLEVKASLPAPAFGRGTLEPGFAAAGVVGLMGLWWVYRALRRRLRVLSFIRESLVQASRGERSVGALAVSSEMGPEARAWNSLLDARDHAALADATSEGSDRRREEAAGDPSRQAFECLWSGVLLLDERLGVIQANGAATVLLKSTRDQVEGKSLAELFPEESARAALAGLSSGAVRHRVQWEVERQADNGASGVVRVTVKPARKGDVFAAIAVLEDVSQQRVADRSRNTLIAQASHELRTPLTNIRLYAEALLEDGDSNPQARTTAINVINQESRRLERIVSDMLSVSEIEAGAFRIRRDDIPLASILDDLKHDFAPQAQDKEITLTFDVAPKLPAMTGDRDKITLAIHNLVGNAIKYTPAGGKVTVRAASMSPGTPQETLIVDVTDTGIGIKPEEHESVFERFYRSADKRIASITGTGLGLTLARDIARIHGGDVTLKSAINEGSTFTLRIPAAAGEPAGRKAA